MENNITLSKNLEKHPAYFGVYINMARHNIFLVDQYLEKRFTGKTSDKRDDEGIASGFLTIPRENNPNHLYSELIRFIPCCNIYDPEFLVSRKEKKEKEIAAKIEEGKDFRKMPLQLKAVFKDINQLRNNFTHFSHTEENWRRNTRISLDTKNFIESVFENALKYCKRRFKDVIPENVIDDLQTLPLFSTQNAQTIELTQDGFVFFTCLFLEREFMFYFINKVMGLKNATTIPFKAKRELFGAFSLRLPHEKVSSSDPEFALNLDILNELNKIPKCVFNHLSKENQILFRPPLDEDRNKRIAENSIREDEEDIDTYIRELQSQYRRGQRFYYLACRLIDEYQILRNFRFQIKIGKYIKKKGTKKFGNELVERDIVEEVYGFGRLSDFKDEEVVRKAINVDNCEAQYFENYSPTIDLKNNKVQFKFFTGNEVLPDVEKINKDGKTIGYVNAGSSNKIVTLSIFELEKILLLEYISNGQANDIIRDFIFRKNTFLHDKNAILTLKKELDIRTPLRRFYEDIKNPSKENKVYKDEFSKRRKLLDEKLKTFGLDFNSIPRVLADYFMHVHFGDRDKAVVKIIQKMKAEAKLKVSDYDNLKRPKIGEMATEIAKDIVDMIISEDVKQRCTSFYYDKMQEALALYADPEKRKMFALVIDELKLNDPSKGHPFLNTLDFMNLTKTGEFYRAYFYAKAGKKGEKGKDLSWMKRTFYSFDRNTKKTNIIIPKNGVPFLVKKLQKQKGITDIDRWIQTYSPNFIDLPANLFDNVLKEKLQSKLTEIGIQFFENERYNELMKKYLSIPENRQTFYNLPREYKIFDQELTIGTEYIDDYKNKILNMASSIVSTKKKEARGKFDEDFTKTKITQLIHKEITHNEKEIRITQEHDVILAISLRSPFQIFNLSAIEQHLNESVTIKADIAGKIVMANRKRKDYGILFKLKSDKRLKGLFSYMDGKEIDYEVLRQLLKKYNDTREIIFEKVFEIEELIIQQYRSDVLGLYKDSNGNDLTGNIKHDPFLSCMVAKGVISENEKALVKKIRDKFSHNEIPTEMLVNWESLFEDMINILDTVYEKIKHSLTIH